MEAALYSTSAVILSPRWSVDKYESSWGDNKDMLRMLDP